MILQAEYFSKQLLFLYKEIPNLNSECKTLVLHCHDANKKYSMNLASELGVQNFSFALLKHCTLGQLLNAYEILNDNGHHLKGE